jgi:hypothetical protein
MYVAFHRLPVSLHDIPVMQLCHHAQVRDFPAADRSNAPPRAFYAVRKDNSFEDFSYIKCTAALFPGKVSRCLCSR